jgi:bidirectional [NiFe] hydrogenase diaphorase subunit
MDNSKLEELARKELERQQGFKYRIFGCSSTACISAGARSTIDSMQLAVKACGCDQNEVEIVNTGCMGLCSRGPLVRVEAEGKEPVLYGDVTPDTALQIIARHLPLDPSADPAEETSNEKAGELAEIRSALIEASSPNDLDNHIVPLDIPFFTKQTRVVLSNTGITDPEKLEDYLAHGGYQALIKVLEEMTPEKLCQEILASGLRGRGGAGFPTGLKWDLTRKQQAEHKYVIVNGDEGDPGAYMDRTVMEDDPHRVLEGMIIAAYAVGADYGYLYIRGEYPVAVDRINKAIRDARRRKLLGKSILGTDFSFNAEVRIGAGAFVCGEETALIHSVEGKRGTPRMRPPYPAASGLNGYPTNINNVETMANIPSIITRGAAWFAGIGTEKSKGTKVFALAGQLNQTGLIEVPMGITLREIVFDIGGGIPNGRAFKAAQTGGPSGGCIPEQFLDEPVDYENLKRLGSIMGSGGLVVIDETTRMPEFARFFMDFCVDESCGKCLPCRVGTVQIRSLLDRLIAGEGTEEDLARLDKLCPIVQRTSLCGLGQSAPNPVVSTLKYFRHEYEELLPVSDPSSS